MRPEELSALIAEHLAAWNRETVASIRVEGVTLVLSPLSDYVDISRVVIAPALRGLGLGSAVMRAVTAWADNTGVALCLTPTVDFGATSVARLTRFYRAHGFTANKGRRADHSVRAAMVRPVGTPTV